MIKNVAVFFGGVSTESDVSAITGAITLNSLDKSKFNPVPVYVDTDGKTYTGEPLFNIDNFKALPYKKLTRVVLIEGGILCAERKRKLKEICRIDAAINCMHGGLGEDGSVAGVINLAGIPLASAGVASSAVAMDKWLTKICLKGLKIPCLAGVCYNSAERAGEKLPFAFPVIVKPAKGGSSIGINRADDEDSLYDAVKYALKYGKKAVVEPFIENMTEINCAVYRSRNGEINVSPCERPVTAHEILTFGDKYESGTRVFPADIDVKLSDKIRNLAAKTYEALDYDGVVRIDFIVKDGKPYVNEINAVPGSLSYYLFCDTLKGFSAMLSELIAAAEEKFKEEKRYISRFESGILSGTGAKGVKRGRKRL